MRVLRVAFQVVVLAAVVGLVAYLYDNLLANDVELDFGFLDQQAGFRIAYTDLGPSDTVLDAMLAGLRNTITVALVGIVLTLILGTLLGIARLSDNWMVRRVAGAYVEALRNVPPLLVDRLREQPRPWPRSRRSQEADETSAACWSCRCPSSASSPRGRRQRLGRTSRCSAVGGGRRAWRSAPGGTGSRSAPGAPARRWLWGGGLVVAVAVVGGYLVLDAPVVLSRPEVDGLSIVGGTRMGLPFVAMLIGLVLYTVVARRRDRARVDPRGAQGADRGGGRRSASRPASACATSCCPRRSASPSPRSSTSA